MQNYLDLMQQILDEGVRKSDRTGTGTTSLFGTNLRFDLSDGFPAVTTKKLAFKTMAAELLWFLRGETNVKSLQEDGCKIWNEWADEDGELGPVYGKQWRSWAGKGGTTHDQIKTALDQIKNNPDSRRIIVSAWNVAELDQMKLPPCHLLFQFNVAGGKLSCSVYQRSVDIFLGLPFNIASYALLTHLMAQMADLDVGDLIFNMGDTHIYHNHVDQVVMQLDRAPKRGVPKLWLNPNIHSLEAFTLDDIRLENYRPHPAIRAPVSV